MKECTTDKAGFRRRRRKVRGGIDELVHQLPPDELIEFLREYCGLDEFCLSLIAAGPDDSERLPKVEYPRIFAVGEPSPGKSCRMPDFQKLVENLTPEERADLIKKLQEGHFHTPVFNFDINLLNTPGFEIGNFQTKTGE